MSWPWLVHDRPSVAACDEDRSGSGDGIPGSFVCIWGRIRRRAVSGGPPELSTAAGASPRRSSGSSPRRRATRIFGPARSVTSWIGGTRPPRRDGHAQVEGHEPPGGEEERGRPTGGQRGRCADDHPRQRSESDEPHGDHLPWLIKSLTKGPWLTCPPLLSFGNAEGRGLGECSWS